MRAYDQLYATANNAASDVYTLGQVAPQDSIREAAGNCQEKLEGARLAIYQSKQLFDRLLAAQAAGAPPELRHALDRQLNAFRRNGVDRDEATQTRLSTLQQRISAASAEFENTSNSDIRTIEASATELSGLPDDVRKGFAVSANGPVRITVDPATQSSILGYADSAALRKQTLHAYRNRGWPSNDALLRRLAADRAELARLLGFKTYADYHLADHMARTAQAAQAFIDQVAANLRTPSDRTIAQMLARLRRDDATLTTVPEWSARRALALLRKEDFDIDPVEIRKYFGYRTTRNGLFELAQDLFGVRIRPWATKTWAPAVEAFEILEHDRIIGRFYIDPYPRKGKYTGAMATGIRIGVMGAATPECALLVNFGEGGGQHRDVVLFFHEFGHVLHTIFSGQVAWAMQNGSELEFDAAEVPSTMLEEWAWNADILSRFARDDRGRSIPSSMVERLVASRKLDAAWADMYNLGLAAVSLAYYSRDLTDADLAAEYFRNMNRFVTLVWTPDTHPHASFDHLVDYAPAFYTYIWSKALAVDLFTRFDKAGLRDVATARAYRETVLAPGGSESMSVLAKRFLGREWSTDAYLARMRVGE